MSMYIDFHVLQTVPPSCINRDDTGSPKTAIYGGAVRARVSSQAWKHAMRAEFKKLFPEEELATRTKFVVDMVVREMLFLDNTLEESGAVKKATAALKEAGISLDEKKNEAKALFFMSHQQAKAVAAIALEGNPKDKVVKAALKKAIKENPSADIALFGRMVASDPSLNNDAAAQVAHAISTHAVQNEYDYFTAVDDLKEDSGAGHLGTVEFNSSTLYRYATVNASDLAKNLGAESVPEVIRKFGQAFICSMPTGKENTFANRTLPDVVYVTIRQDQPVNLCGAFETPVCRSVNGYTAASEAALVRYAETVYSRYAAQPMKAFGLGDSIGEIAETMPLPELLAALEQMVCEQLCEV
ncbi:MAG: type I-E CRISPR-associated protein Cas7/Cse4/CasC [Ruminococcus sp.]|nr:type I-E CRISPR-associated protein Cas7/Cse4/CasC [Ruminococcus sp.]